MFGKRSARIPRDVAIDVLTAVTCAPITRTIRDMRSGVDLRSEHGLPEAGVSSCVNVIAIPIDDLNDEPVGHLDGSTRAPLDQALDNLY